MDDQIKLRSSDILNLPDAPEFISKPPKYTLLEMAAMCEKMLPLWNKERYSKPQPEFIGEVFRFK